MGQLLSFAIESGIIMLALYLIYKWILASENQYRFNRVILLSIYAVSLLIIPILSSFEVSETPTAIGSIKLTDTMAIINTPTAATTSEIIWRIIVWIYLAGIILVFAKTIVTVIRLISIIRHGENHHCKGHTLVLTDSKGISPFSWMNYIVMSRDDYNDSGEIIMTHEEQHIRCHHWIDLLIAQLIITINWFNPAAWLLREELKSVHEYQADNRVLAGGTDARTYQLLLIKKAVGARFPSLANSLNHSKLKKRITMMNNQSTSAKRRLRALALVPAIALAVVATNIPMVASAIDNSASATLTSVNSDKDTQNSQRKLTVTTVNGKITVYQNDSTYVSANSDIKPIFMVDGSVVENVDNIDPANISSISVDNQGESPVINITTKGLTNLDVLQYLRHELLEFNNDNGTNIKLRFSGIDDLQVLSGKYCDDKNEHPFNNINVDKMNDGSYIVDLHLNTKMTNLNRTLIRLSTNLGNIAIPIMTASDN